MSTHSTNQSSLAETALTLDADFQTFERLAFEIEEIPINTERGLDRAQKLLLQVDACGKRISTGMPALAQALEDARRRTEIAAGLVAEKATAVQARENETMEFLERFKALGETVKKVTAVIAQLKQPPSAEMTADEKSLLAEKLPEFNDQLGMLVEAARQLMQDAHAANLKQLESNADSLRQSIQTARHRLGQFVDRFNQPARSAH